LYPFPGDSELVYSALKALFPLHFIEWKYLLSLPGCKRQQFHCDHKDFYHFCHKEGEGEDGQEDSNNDNNYDNNSNNNNQIPFSAILSLADDTHFINDLGELVNLTFGSLIIFSGNK